MAPLNAAPRHRRICDVHLVLIRDEHVFLTLRQGGYASGLWQIPSGHLEASEPTDEGAARGGLEEIGVRVNVEHLKMVHFMDHQAPGEEPRLGVFYRATRWEGEPCNAEPHKCGGIGWYPLDAIPENTVRYHAAALAHIAAGRSYAQFGWGPARAVVH